MRMNISWSWPLQLHSYICNYNYVIAMTKHSNSIRVTYKESSIQPNLKITSLQQRPIILFHRKHPSRSLSIAPLAASSTTTTKVPPPYFLAHLTLTDLQKQREDDTQWHTPYNFLVSSLPCHALESIQGHLPYHRRGRRTAASLRGRFYLFSLHTPIWSEYVWKRNNLQNLIDANNRKMVQ